MNYVVIGILGTSRVSCGSEMSGIIRGAGHENPVDGEGRRSS